MNCDMCNKDAIYLDDLRDEYKTDDMQKICSDCSYLVNRQMDSVRKVTHNIFKTTIKRFMANLKADKGAKA